jgi:3-hydroxybutyryl-CoA dehydrogenase
MNTHSSANQHLSLNGVPLLVVGAGIMGAGIAQVAALAGHPVRLFDLREGAAQNAIAQLGKVMSSLVAKGRLTAELAAAALGRITPAATLQDAQDAALVVEAVVENLEAKRSLFRQLEDLLPATAVLATNTSSISITAIAGGLRHPQRVVGMHFFNPVFQMKLVEVVSGLQTDPAVANAVFELASTWGKLAVHAKSTPGFIVNRIARPFYAEAWLLLQELVATPAVLDACLRAAGFRMGPCELMDMIGHDTNLAVTQQVFEANYFDKRYVPSLLQREMVLGGLLGRKSGQGFYTHTGGSPATATGVPTSVPPRTLDAAQALAPTLLLPPQSLVVHGQGPWVDALQARLTSKWSEQNTTRIVVSRDTTSGWCGLAVDGAQLRRCQGPTATDTATQTGVAQTAVFDRLPSQTEPATLAFAVAEQAPSGWATQAAAWLALLGHQPVRVLDVPGLVVTRTLAMLINEAADAVSQGVCTAAGANAAMRLGVNYPQGPFEWLAGWSASGVVAVLDALDHHHRGERYRANLSLRRQAAAEPATTP